MTQKTNSKIKALADKADLFDDVLKRNISANPDLPVKFIKDILIAKKQSMKPFDMEPEE